MIELTKENFESEVLNYDGEVLVDFWTPGCGACRMLVSTLIQVEKEMPDIKICKVNLLEIPELADQYNVVGVPTLLLFIEGSLRTRIIGLRSKEDIISRL